MNLMNDQKFSNAINAYCSGLSLKPSYDHKNLQALYHNGKYLGGAPRSSYQLFDQIGNDKVTLVQKGLITMARLLSRLTKGIYPDWLSRFEALLDNFGIKGWHRAMLMSELTYDPNYFGISQDQFESLKDYYFRTDWKQKYDKYIEKKKNEELLNNLKG